MNLPAIKAQTGLSGKSSAAGYRGRIAPTPTGFLHLGHARTFGTAWQRAQAAGGTLLYRLEDLDQARCRPEFAAAAVEDLRWYGLDWQEGPDMGGPHASYIQSERGDWHREIWRRLKDGGHIYPSPHSRREVQAAQQAASAPNEGDAPEPIFPPSLRPPPGTGQNRTHPGEENWRFRVPDGEGVGFEDGRLGQSVFTAGVDFGDFIVWRRDGFAAYDLAVVADDHAMEITEVVRGEDLLLATAKQLLLYRALGWEAPAWFHTPLVRDAEGVRLAKRHASLSIRALAEAGWRAERLWRELPPGFFVS
ncbi:MAG: glutamate--tRNA ligase family protein [Verrucomicrobiota bacterium JB022]|nr:glutamate--tRNA ligase family protein [Verrucomicrobiota bacterium JB022]